MKYILIVLTSLLCGCIIITKKVEAIHVSGNVIDKLSNKPVEGAVVYLHYGATSLWGDHSKSMGHTLTNNDGYFNITVEDVRLWGGTGGGIDGNISDYPSVAIKKKGYNLHFYTIFPKHLQGEKMYAVIQPTNRK